MLLLTQASEGCTTVLPPYADAKKTCWDGDTGAGTWAVENALELLDAENEWYYDAGEEI